MRPLEEVASWGGIFFWPLSLCPFLHLLFTRKPPSLHPIGIVICLHPWGQATAGCALSCPLQYFGLRNKGGNCVFSRAPFPSFLLFASSSALLTSTDWLCLAEWATSWNSSLVFQLSCQRAQEDRLCLACVLERFPTLSFIVSDIFGSANTWEWHRDKAGSVGWGHLGSST